MNTEFISETSASAFEISDALFIVSNIFIVMASSIRRRCVCCVWLTEQRWQWEWALETQWHAEVVTSWHHDNAFTSLRLSQERWRRFWRFFTHRRSYLEVLHSSTWWGQRQKHYHVHTFMNNTHFMHTANEEKCDDIAAYFTSK